MEEFLHDREGDFACRTIYARMNRLVPNCKGLPAMKITLLIRKSVPLFLPPCFSLSDII